MDQLESLPYLDTIVKEGLRLHCVYPTASRIATKDDVIPVEKPYVDRHGVTKDYIA
jgi:cytochrome P450